MASIEVKVDCRKSDGTLCTKCCWDTHMPLTREDILRIESLGYSREFFVEYDSQGIPRLKNTEEHCVFLDPSRGCRIYPWRPLGCRLYPLVFDIDSCKVVVDTLCPKHRIIGADVIKKFTPVLLEFVFEVYGSIPCRW